MTATVPLQRIESRKRTLLAGNVSIVALLGLGLSLVFPLLWTVRVQAQACPSGGDVCSQAYLDGLPVPDPMNGAHRVVQLVNCSCQTLLGATNAAHRSGDPGFPVFPREGTWVMQPYGTVDKNGNPLNVLTVDIPQEWERTQCPNGEHNCPGPVGPNIWARTGCRYDIATNRAQCETGGCSDQYDCSAASQSQAGFTTISEWTFYQPSGVYHIDNFDISTVNGSSLNLDIEGKNGVNALCLPGTKYAGQFVCDPTAPYDQKWLAYNYPLTVHGADLRANDKKTNQYCTDDATGTSFILKRSDIHKKGNGINGLDYVIVDQNGNPTMPPGDNPLACFSNCGQYYFPRTPASTCDPTDPNDPSCYGWNTLCDANPTGDYYSQACQTDADCIVTYKNGKPLNLHSSCFYNGNGKPTCAARAFYQTPTMECPATNLVNIADPIAGSPTGGMDAVACTYTYGSYNPLDPGKTTRIDYSDQPPATPCAKVIGPDGKQVPCVGDDMIHEVFHGAYTWPNDPEVFDSDSPAYRIIFAPGGTSVPITPAQGVPLCSDLPSNYNYTLNYQKGVNSTCIVSVDGENAHLAIARPNSEPWSCSVDPSGAGSNGVLCRWHPTPTGSPNGCSPPFTDQFVSNSACGLIDGGPTTGTSLVSNSFKPNSGDPLFLEVTIATPDPTKPVNLPISFSGCVPPSGQGSWIQVTKPLSFGSATNPQQGLVAWYQGIANTAAECQVTVTLAEAAPATLKVYDVPAAVVGEGGYPTLDTTSSASGVYTLSQANPFVSAQMQPGASTNYALDLKLGSLLQVNQQLTPMTWWSGLWLTDSLKYPTNTQCINNYFCPTDDGADYLPGHGPYSSSADAGHQVVAMGMHALGRPSHGGTAFNWGGQAIYIELKQTPFSLACASSSAQVGVPYSSPLVANGGTPPYFYSTSAGLPPGLTLPLNWQGYVVGTPTTAGTYPYTATTVDSAPHPHTVAAKCSITVTQ